jgi:hypothetical protein
MRSGDADGLYSLGCRGHWFIEMWGKVVLAGTKLLTSLGRSRPALVSHLSRAELLRTLSLGCPVCVLETEATQRFCFWFLNEYYGEAAWVDRLVSSVGFCREHTWMLVARNAPYRLSYVALYLTEALLTKGPSRWPRRSQCPLCRELASMKEWWCRDMALLMTEEEFARSYQASPGLCNAHKQMVLNNAPRALRTSVAWILGQNQHRNVGT